jgi:serine protease AprX
MARNNLLLWRYVLVLAGVLSLSSFTRAQENRYMVFFTDKLGTPHAVEHPHTFLSAHAIERRATLGIAIGEDDLPVSPVYLQGIRDLDVEVWFTTRWWNGALIQAHPDQIPFIQSLPYVQEVEWVAPGKKLTFGRIKWTEETQTDPDYINLGQLEMLGIDHMHREGLMGQGIRIAVADGGFRGVNTQAAFAHLFSNQQIAQTIDFVTGGEDVYQFSDHGTRVVSQLAAITDEGYHGAVPQATFFIYLTEDVGSEYRIEEYNWLFAAEKADSAGVHIMHTSLGYSDFDDTSMNYTPADMDGQTALITRAANVAASKGMLLVAAAGNYGASAWEIISAPADAPGVLAVGSVNAQKMRAASSSIGPSADGRIKPDVMAQGAGALVVNQTGSVALTSGTSFSSPLVTGLTAGLIQQFPQLGPFSLMDAIRLSADRATHPDFQYGYGIPHFLAVRNYLSPAASTPGIHVYPNPFQQMLTIQTGTPGETGEIFGILMDAQGRLVKEFSAVLNWAHPLLQLDLPDLPRGYYILRIRENQRVHTRRLVKY